MERTVWRNQWTPLASAGPVGRVKPVVEGLPRERMRENVSGAGALVAEAATAGRE
jgi:hypothetical protein